MRVLCCTLSVIELLQYFPFTCKHDFDGILSILEGKFMKILVTWHWRTITRMVENIVRIYKHVTYPYIKRVLSMAKQSGKSNILIHREL